MTQFNRIENKISTEENVTEFNANKDKIAETVTKVKEFIRSEKISDDDKNELAEIVNHVDAYLGFFDKAPPEIISEIFDYLSINDLKNVEKVSLDFSEIASDVIERKGIYDFKLQETLEKSFPKVFLAEYDNSQYFYDTRGGHWNAEKFSKQHELELKFAKSLDLSLFLVSQEFLDFICGNCPKLESLTVYVPDEFKIEDLKTVKNLSLLKLINFDFDISSLISEDRMKILCELKNLKSISLPDSSIDNTDVKKLKEELNLTSLDLTNSPFLTKDCIVHLKEMTDLKVLNLTNCGISEDAIHELKRALPDTEIITKS